MIKVFVDESGDLGERGQRYFVIALLVPQRSKRISNFMKRFCVRHGLREVKASALSFPQKQEVFDRLGAANDYSVSYIVADKLNIRSRHLFADKNLIYNYLFSFAIKKTIRGANEDVCILLDNHSVKTKSLNSLCDYIKLKAYGEWGFRHELHISYIDSHHSKAIQAADVVANAVYAKYVHGKEHFYGKLMIGESIKFPRQHFGLN